ncbi:MAG: hypothetical protein NWF08_00010 [Candidatus Bathyarchaeota archaeon]|nr:hypothetical protein [Candidatus Bathyarchaeota archaeon]
MSKMIEKSHKMKIYALISLVIIIISISLSTYRYSNIPSHLEITVELSLHRSADRSWGIIESFSLKMVEEPLETYDEVILIRAAYPNDISDYTWTLMFVLNESSSNPDSLPYEIVPTDNNAGNYEGPVFHTIENKGEFKLWILLYGEEDGLYLEDHEMRVITIY